MLKDAGISPLLSLPLFLLFSYFFYYLFLIFLFFFAFLSPTNEQQIELIIISIAEEVVTLDDLSLDIIRKVSRREQGERKGSETLVNLFLLFF